MINEIKRRLEAGEVVELECIDREGFLASHFRDMNERILARESITVESISEGRGVVFLEKIEGHTGFDGIDFNELKYFKIKEKEPTFDDLVDVAIQAFKDGVLTGVEVNSKDVRYISFWFGSRKHEGQVFDQRDDYSEDIEHIKSLYKESFVINDIESLRRVREGAEGVLLNGSRFIVRWESEKYLTKSKLYIEFDESEITNEASLEVLKGAVIVQKVTQ